MQGFPPRSVLNIIFYNLFSCVDLVFHALVLYVILLACNKFE